MSGQQPAQPYPFADDIEPTSELDPVPLITPFQRYVVNSLNRLNTAQGEFTGEIVALKQSVNVLLPAVAELQKRAALWNKAVSVAKYALPAIALQLFPALAKYIPIITDAIGKAGLQ